LREAAFTFLGSFLVTCYDLTGVTASGDMAGPGSIAVDPSVIPLGTQIYVQGVGLRTADDTGGAIIGDHVDIWEPTYYACANWGAQVRDVYRVGP
jgi:3D (Asp-Asp-Asp) domain-containing protein